MEDLNYNPYNPANVKKMLEDEMKDCVRYKIYETCEEMKKHYGFLTNEEINFSITNKNDSYIRKYYNDQDKEKKTELERQRIEEERREAEIKRIETICSKLPDLPAEKLENLLEEDYVSKWQLPEELKLEKLDFFEMIAGKYSTLSEFEKERSKIITLKQHYKKHIAWEKRQVLLKKRIKSCGADIQNETGLQKFLNRNFGNFKTEDSFQKEVYGKVYNSTSQFKILYGNYGAGKTHLAFSIAIRKLKNSFFSECRYIEDNYIYSMDSFFYICSRTLATEYRKQNFDFTKNFDDYVSSIVRNNSLVIVDEIGQADDIEAERSALYKLIDSCNENGLEVVLCTNLNKDELYNLLTQRTLSRLSEDADFIEFKGRDYRFKKRKQ